MRRNLFLLVFLILLPLSASLLFTRAASSVEQTSILCDNKWKFGSEEEQEKLIHWADIFKREDKKELKVSGFRLLCESRCRNIIFVSKRQRGLKFPLCKMECFLNTSADY